MDFIDGFSSCFHRGLEAEGIVGTDQIIINRLGNADHRYPLLGEKFRGSHGAVAADNNQSIDAIFL